MSALIHKLRSGKNVKLFYYMRAHGRRLIPRAWFMWRRKALLRQLRSRSDYEALKSRIDYYCGFAPTVLPDDSPTIGGPQMKCQKVYIHDSEEVRRYFAPDLRWRLVPGDNVAVFDVPSITKSRPVGAGSANDVLLKLNKVRHFIFLKDRKRWEDKKPMAIFRGRVANKKERKEFVRMYAGHELVDAGCVDRPSDLPERCYVDKISLYAHFDYKFIVCLEGNDVASNLKWVMNSNSIAVMPRPRNETWFMEGRLEPGIHYVEIRDDYTDLEDRLRYYMSHPEEAQMILDNAHRWTAQFKDKKTERLVSLGVMQNYLVNTGQLDEPLV